ncbi:hypothetical protein AVEN_200188-1 [Araneus ventricosus]|uniref:Uncharacterized protein n=1 Tax=Araneus ventricosus TaxID=182803 RepID=A0A4Y2MHM3_ARAVE|nr:hypothetical protein AVEN_200188-1 [Araneus ventricosus]
MKLQCTHPFPASPHCRNESYSALCQILHAMLDSVLVKNGGSPFLRGGYSGICQELITCLYRSTGLARNKFPTSEGSRMPSIGPTPDRTGIC